MEQADASAFSVRVDGELREVDAAGAPGGSWSLLVDGRQCEALVVEKKPGRFEVRIADGDASADFVLELVG
jgi:hypothetical protein